MVFVAFQESYYKYVLSLRRRSLLSVLFANTLAHV